VVNFGIAGGVSDPVVLIFSLFFIVTSAAVKGNLSQWRREASFVSSECFIVSSAWDARGLQA